MARSILSVGALLMVVASSACKSTDAPAADAPAFDSSDAAVAALIEAARSGSTDALRAVLGPDADALLVAGDSVAAQVELASFVELYDEAHATEQDESGAVVLLVGADEWPFPIPIRSAGHTWSFDTASGRQELIDRRVGRNELSAIEVCRAIGDAQEEFRASSPESNGAYAMRFFSQEGRQDGLFWPETESAGPSPIGELAARAAVDGYRRAEEGQRQSYHGYYYRLLTAQGPSAPGGARTYVEDGQLVGGYAVVAWPAEYESSGIMTFMMGARGVVYERDLGPETDGLASSMTAFDPDLDWAICGD